MTEPARTDAPTDAPSDAAGPSQSVLLDDELRKALEAILLVVEEPVDANTLAQVLEAPTEQVTATLQALRAEYVDAGRGFVLREVAGGWRYYTDPGAAPYVERFVLNGRSGRLSQASLETLAIIAYKQPVTRAQVSQIRGVDADGAVRSLVARGLVEEIGRAELPGQPLLYATTASFLERLGLASLEDLPRLPELMPDGPPPEEPPPGGYKAARRELDALARGELPADDVRQIELDVDQPVDLETARPADGDDADDDHDGQEPW